MTALVHIVKDLPHMDPPDHQQQEFLPEISTCGLDNFRFQKFKTTNMISLKPSSYLGGPGTNTNTMMNAEISLEGSFLFTVRCRAYSQCPGAGRGCSMFRLESDSHSPNEGGDPDAYCKSEVTQKGTTAVYLGDVWDQERWH